MPFKIIHADITTLDVDAIVNAANNSLLGGGGVDGAIHHAAGPQLLLETRTLGGCATGDAKITKGYSLKARHVIHTVGPVWNGGTHGEEGLLRSCYRKSLELAEANQLESVAFPLISAGIYGYPKDQAMKVAVSEITDFLMDHDLTVYLVVYDKKSFAFSEKLFSKVQDFIDDNLVIEEDFFHEDALLSSEATDFYDVHSTKRSLNDVLAELDDTFSEHLLRLIGQKGKTDVETYKRANVDRKLFSKIRNDRQYQPSKVTAIAFAIALELNLDETKDLLMKAGYALSHCSRFDLIIEYFIAQGNYDIYKINEALFAFDQSLLGA